MHVHVAHSAHRSGVFCMEMTFPNQVPVERVAGVCHSSFESNSCIQVAEQPGGGCITHTLQIHHSLDSSQERKQQKWIKMVVIPSAVTKAQHATD